MGNRSAERKELHDRVVGVVGEALKSTYPEDEVHLNPGQERNREVEGEYPDAVVVSKAEEAVRVVAEVETEETINEEAADQWKRYGDLASFYLFVPKGSEGGAQDLVREHAVEVGFLYSWFEADGDIGFDLETEY